MGARCIFIFLSCIFSAHTFNFDNKTFVKHYHQEPGSMFGFTVAQYLDKNTGSILVGAPRAKTIQPNVYKGGYVFKCPIDQHDSCVPQYFDTRGDDYSGIRKENKSEQFFGGTLSASSDGVVVACAPLYRIIQEKNTNDDGSFPVGVCYVASNSFTNISPYSPCLERPSDACQTGFASSISKDGTSLYLGAPGTLGFQGQLFSKALNSRVVIDTSLSEDAGSDFNSYLGYSVTAVDFKGQKEVAVGMPRGGHPMGKVLIYTWDLNNYQNITGEQIGAYFGYSLASGDIDGNGFDDLIIGAPLYTDPINPDVYERGRVYVVYRDESELKFQRVDRLDGKITKARFGLSLASLGDIDFDGFGDFAVGAPYDGPKGHGVVYIYRGGPSGVRTVPSQIIKPEHFGSYPPITTFGFSLSGGMDLDRNQYNDIVIGAYNSNTVVLLKARPVVKVDARIILQSKVIYLQDANCDLLNGDKAVCSSFRYCLTYSGVNVDKETAFNIRFALDSKHRIPRMFSKEIEGSTIFNRVINLSQNVEHCDDVGVYFWPNMTDQLSASPMEVQMWYNLEVENESSYQERNPRAVPTQMMDQSSQNMARNTINIMRDCGPDRICVPDLRLSVHSNTNTYYLGSNKDISFEVLIKNEGEDAFETQYALKMPPGVNYVKVERLNELATDLRIHCSAPSPFNDFTLTCDLGNPMPAGETINFKVYVRPHKINGMTQSYEFPMEVTSANEELTNTASDKRHNLFIKILVRTDLSLNGKSEPSDLQYNATMQIIEKNITTETDIGPQILHIYSLRNNGSSDIEQVEIDVVWPYQTLEGDDFMYLLEQPEITRNLRCDPAQYVNYRNVELNLSTRTKSYLPWSYNAEESEQSSVLSISSIFDDNIDDASYNYYSGNANRGDVLDHVTKPTKEKKIPIYRRDVSQVTDDLHEFLETSSLCKKFRCARMHCESSTLGRNQEIWISLRARVNENALLKVSSDVLKVASKLAARVTRVPYIGQPVDTKIYTYSVGTNIIRPLEPAGIPLWIIILAIIAGVVLLSLLVYWFYKCGFFNRNRPTAEAPEAQPMNV